MTNSTPPDNKPLWLDFWVEDNLGEVTSAWKYNPGPQSDYSTIHVIEAAPALAEIEKLRAENENWLSGWQKLKDAEREKRLSQTVKLKAALAAKELVIEKLREQRNKLHLEMTNYYEASFKTQQQEADFYAAKDDAEIEKLEQKT